MGEWIDVSSDHVQRALTADGAVQIDDDTWMIDDDADHTALRADSDGAPSTRQQAKQMGWNAPMQG